MAKSLKDKFHEAMLQQYESAKKETRYSFNGFRNMINKHGGVEAAKKLIKSLTPSEGFLKLSESKNLHLSAEYLVIQDEWKKLFTEEEIAMARKKLKDYNFPNTK